MITKVPYSSAHTHMHLSLRLFQATVEELRRNEQAALERAATAETRARQAAADAVRTAERHTVKIRQHQQVSRTWFLASFCIFGGDIPVALAASPDDQRTAAQGVCVLNVKTQGVDVIAFQAEDKWNECAWLFSLFPTFYRWDNVFCIVRTSGPEDHPKPDGGQRKQIHSTQSRA